MDQFADNLVQTSDGLWVSKTHSFVSYPSDGMDYTYRLEEHSYWFIHRNRCISSIVSQFPFEGPLFDIGGGNGFVSQAIRQLGLDTVLVEPDPSGSQHALERGLKPVIAAAFEDAGFKPGCMGAVGLFDVLEHIQDDAAFLTQIRHFLKPKGRLFITVPAYQFLWSADDDLAGHFRRYTLDGLCENLQKVGYTLNYASYIFSFLPLPVFLFRTLPSRLKLRKNLQLDANNEGSEYTARISLLDWYLEQEFKWIRSLKQIPWGGSCLIAASRGD